MSQCIPRTSYSIPVMSVDGPWSATVLPVLAPLSVLMCIFKTTSVYTWLMREMANCNDLFQLISGAFFETMLNDVSVFVHKYCDQLICNHCVPQYFIIILGIFGNISLKFTYLYIHILTLFNKTLKTLTKIHNFKNLICWAIISR